MILWWIQLSLRSGFITSSVSTAALLQMLTTQGLKWNNTLTYYNSLLLLLLLTKQFLRLCFGLMTLTWMGMLTTNSSAPEGTFEHYENMIEAVTVPSLSPPLCLKEFSLELWPLSLRCGDEGSLSLDTSGSVSLSVMQGVMLCCLFRVSGEVTPWAKRGRHWNILHTECSRRPIPKIKEGKVFGLAIMRDYNTHHWYRIWQRHCHMTYYITFLENNPAEKTYELHSWGVHKVLFKLYLISQECKFVRAKNQLQQ